MAHGTAKPSTIRCCASLWGSNMSLSESIEKAVAFICLSMPGSFIEEDDAAADRCWEIIDEAWFATGLRRLELARLAIQIRPQCAEARLLLVQDASPDAPDLLLARDLYDNDFETARHALDPKLFEHSIGRFWKLSETRCYMRARAGLARCLWLLGQRQQALEHWLDMLRLNPGDNQGIRYLILAHTLLEIRTAKRLTKILEEYKYDSSAFWLYTTALQHFRKARASAIANRSLTKALKAHRLVPPYLIGRKNLPANLTLPDLQAAESEAAQYAVIAIHAWTATPGALDWLAFANDLLSTKVASRRQRWPY